jgi:RNA polymerase sigma-70 factor (ECF subfamily)
MQQELSADDRAYVYAVIRRILRCHEVANDATQDALLLAHRYRESFRGSSAFRTWLYRIAVTTACGHLRKQRRSREDLVHELEFAVDPIDPAPSPEQELESRELVDRMRVVLDGIPASQRSVFVLRVAEHSEPEIAARLGISLANVKIRAHRARQKLRDELRDAA